MNGFEFVITLVGIILGSITIWIMMFAASRKKPSRNSESDTRYNLAQLSSMAESLQDRIDTLEEILDAEIPDWREQHEKSAEQSSN